MFVKEFMPLLLLENWHHIIDKSTRDLKIKFGIDKIPIENHRLPNMYWMHKNPIKTRFIIASPKSSIKPLARTITSIFRLLFRQIQTYDDNCWFFTGVNTFLGGT